MATLKQKLVASKLQETAGNVSRAMRLAGYSSASAKDPQRLTRSKGWQKLMDKYLPDNKLLKVHRELLDNPDWRARDAGLDKAYKIKGKMHSMNQSEERGSQELEAVILRIRQILPSSEL